MCRSATATMGPREASICDPAGSEALSPCTMRRFRLTGTVEGLRQKRDMRGCGFVRSSREKSCDSKRELAQWLHQDDVEQYLLITAGAGHLPGEMEKYAETPRADHPVSSGAPAGVVRASFGRNASSKWAQRSAIRQYGWRERQDPKGKVHYTDGDPQMQSVRNTSARRSGETDSCGVGEHRTAQKAQEV
jgi:hypothetical protein